MIGNFKICKSEEYIFHLECLLKTRECHAGEEVRTGLDDKEIEWGTFTYI